MLEAKELALSAAEQNRCGLCARVLGLECELDRVIRGSASASDDSVEPKACVSTVAGGVHMVDGASAPSDERVGRAAAGLCVVGVQTDCDVYWQMQRDLDDLRVERAQLLSGLDRVTCGSPDSRVAPVGSPFLDSESPVTCSDTQLDGRRSAAALAERDAT